MLYIAVKCPGSPKVFHLISNDDFIGPNSKFTFDFKNTKKIYVQHTSFIKAIEATFGPERLMDRVNIHIALSFTEITRFGFFVISSSPCEATRARDILNKLADLQKHRGAFYQKSLKNLTFVTGQTLADFNAKKAYTLANPPLKPLPPEQLPPPPPPLPHPLTAPPQLSAPIFPPSSSALPSIHLLLKSIESLAALYLAAQELEADIPMDTDILMEENTHLLLNFLQGGDDSAKSFSSADENEMAESKQNLGNSPKI
ncbi:MAG: hypothetical protein ACHQJ6_07140 [Candidatus Berkiellales bacterium]